MRDEKNKHNSNTLKEEGLIQWHKSQHFLP